MNTSKRIVFLILLTFVAASVAEDIKSPSNNPATNAANQSTALLNSISANSLRSNLTYIASDALEGRATPSRRLDLAADYIAAQFKAAGLEPAGDEGYFQIADWKKIAPHHKESKAAEPAANTPTKVRNVIGLLRGSDPTLKDTYVLVSAHYDHLGTKDGQIYNGANDDGSGTVSVIELARAFGSLKQRTKRSIVFMTFFGEEEGLIGSRYYGAHPIFPIANTVAGINLEQIGRTDDSERTQIAAANITGFDFSEVGDIIKNAGIAAGVDIWKHPINSDRYFAYSDNQALADQGVPAHTISVAYDFSDYHQPGDDTDKIDFANMVKINRAVALAVETIANNPQAPQWNAANPKAEKYLRVWNQQHPKK